MEKRIKIYSIIIAVIYMAVVVHHVASEWNNMKRDFMKGYNGKQSPNDTYYVKISPADASIAFHDKIIDKVTGKEVGAEINYLSLTIDNSNPSITHSLLCILKMLFALVILFLLIYIPVLFFFIVKPILKGRVLSHDVARRLIRMGRMLILMFAGSFLLFSLGDYLIAKGLVDLPGYTVILDSTNWSLLILGLVTLMLGEILKFALRMKEEQDLTI